MPRRPYDGGRQVTLSGRTLEQWLHPPLILVLLSLVTFEMKVNNGAPVSGSADGRMKGALLLAGVFRIIVKASTGP